MEVISAAHAKWKLRRFLRSRIFWTRRILLFDEKYELVDESELNLKPVSVSGGECEDRAWVMMARVVEAHPQLLFGFAEGYDGRGLKHAWCFFINKRMLTRYVEPDTGEIYGPTNERVYHFIR